MTDTVSTGADIVIVEDQADLAEIYKTNLEVEGYKCAVAYDGIQALEVIETNRPRLVLLDLMIPKFSGEQVLRFIREAAWGKAVKVLVITNLNESEAPPTLRDLHIEGYLVKANLSDNQINQVVDTILKPAGQTGGTSLEA